MRNGVRPLRPVLRTTLLFGLLALAACHQHVAFDQGGCDQDSECGLSTWHCDTTTATCVQCLSDDHCAALGIGRVRCDTAAHRCIECGADDDCGQGRVCRAHHCVTLCNAEGTSASCPSSAPYCESDDDSGFCVQCGDDLPQACNGAAVAGPICGRLGMCIACQSDTDCHAPTAHCETFSGRCVECVANKDCSGGTVCDPAANRCVSPQ